MSAGKIQEQATVHPLSQVLPKKVTVREVGPRDGFQSLVRVFSIDEKLVVIEALINAGVRRMETTAFVSARAIPQLSDAAALMARVSRETVRHAALVPNLTGARAALTAGVDEVVVVVSASDAHNQANVRRTVDESIADLDDIFSLAGEKNIPVICSAATAFTATR